jgi:hypothetical protein
MHRTRLWWALVVVLLALLPASGAQATLVRADYALNFVPPSPMTCSSVTGLDLTGYRLGGTLAFFYQFGRAGDLVQTHPGPPQIAGIACGASGAGAFAFDLDLGAGPATLFLSFGGALVSVNPGPPQYPVFAFAAGTAAPEGQPQSAPRLDLGVISVGSNPGTPDMPLFAFASPGVQVGTLSVTFSQVPEPATALVVALGLAALAWAGRRRSRARR